MMLIVLLLTTAVALCLVGGQQQQLPYELTLDFHQYSNPSHTIYDGITCCHPEFFCFTACDTLLALCFRIGGTSHDNSDCPSGLFTLGFIEGDDVTFADAVGISENPIVVPVSVLPPSGYQLLIRSFNFISLMQIEVVDNIFIEIPASTLEEPSPPGLYSGEFHANNPVTIDLSYSLKCSPNYKLCTVNTLLQCVPESECIDGSESLSVLTPQTDLIVFPDRSFDRSRAVAPMTYTSSHSSTSSLVLSVTPSSSFSTNVATAPGAVPVVAITGAAVGVLVFAAVIVVLVVVGVAIAHRKKKKKIKSS